MSSRILNMIAEKSLSFDNIFFFPELGEFYTRSSTLNLASGI